LAQLRQRNLAANLKRDELQKAKQFLRLSDAVELKDLGERFVVEKRYTSPSTDQMLEDEASHYGESDFRSMVIRIPLKKSSPRSPSTGLSGGREWHMTSIFLMGTPRQENLGMVTMGQITVPLPVVISVVFLERAGLTPMLKAASGGIMVLVAPVSRASLRKTGLPFPHSIA